ncbi:MAG: glycerophosphodiester phosphodiesterase family protein [Verrucomicrobiota bacterium]
MASDPLIIAHRGASAVAPENTRAAIREAIRMGAPVIEFDVRVTSDGQLVLFHDETLERITGRKTEIESVSWDDLKEMDVGSWFDSERFPDEKPVLLSEAIALCLEAEVIPLIERKSGKAEAYVEVIRKSTAAERVIVQSFDWRFLVGLSGMRPALRIGALGSKKLDRKRKGYLKELSPDWVGWKSADLSKDGLLWLQENGFTVALWTVNDPDEAKRWLDQGADAIITDRPDEMLSLLP